MVEGVPEKMRGHLNSLALSWFFKLLGRVLSCIFSESVVVVTAETCEMSEGSDDQIDGLEFGLAL